MRVERMNKKILALLLIVIISAAVAIPAYSALAVNPKPKDYDKNGFIRNA